MFTVAFQSFLSVFFIKKYFQNLQFWKILNQLKICFEQITFHLEKISEQSTSALKKFSIIDNKFVKNKCK